MSDLVVPLAYLLMGSGMTCFSGDNVLDPVKYATQKPEATRI